MSITQDQRETTPLSLNLGPVEPPPPTPDYIVLNLDDDLTALTINPSVEPIKPVIKPLPNPNPSPSVNPQLPVVTIYTDGACPHNPGGPGGWACLLSFKHNTKVLTGVEARSTNNRAELLAALHALQALNRPCRVHLYTDSTYLIRGMAGATRKVNQDLWAALDAAAQPHVLTFHWVQGHAQTTASPNHRVDALAKAAARARTGNWS